MKDWKTTLGGAVSGLASIFGGVEAIRQGHFEMGASALIAGIGLLFKGWASKDK